MCQINLNFNCSNWTERLCVTEVNTHVLLLWIFEYNCERFYHKLDRVWVISVVILILKHQREREKEREREKQIETESSRVRQKDSPQRWQVPAQAGRPWWRCCNGTHHSSVQTGCCLGWCRAWSRRFEARRRFGHYGGWSPQMGPIPPILSSAESSTIM